jgi:hypothetical protein
MKPLTCCASLFILLTASAFVHAETKFDAAARAKAIAPFIEEETAVVGHVDLARVQLDPLFVMLARLVPAAPGEFDRAKKEAAKSLDAAKQVGVNEAYCVVTPGGQGWQPDIFWVIPVASGSDESRVRAALHIPPNEGRMADGMFLLEMSPKIDSQVNRPTKQFRPAPRPELTAAFEAAGDTAAQVVLIPPEYAHRVIEELAPQLPKELGGGSISILSRGISWGAVGLDFPPRESLRLVIKSADVQSANALRTKLADVLRAVGKIETVRKAAPKFDEIAIALSPRVDGDRLVLSLDKKGLEDVMTLLALPVEAMRASAIRMQSTNNLKQIALAMHNYAQANRHFPAPASHGPDGKPLLSWRVHILPYMEQNALFKQFHLDEPWDSPHNRTLIDQMPAVYRLPISKAEKGRTNYLLPVGNGAAFAADKPTEFRDITDGTSNTIMVVEVDDQHAAVWTKPDDWAFDPKDVTKGLGRFFDGGFNAAICDGSVRFMQRDFDPKKLRAVFTRAGREPIGFD